MAHVPFEAIMKNFGTKDVEAFAGIPAQQLYIFPGSKCNSTTYESLLTNLIPQAPPNPDAKAPEDPQGQIPNPFIYKFSEVNATKLAGGAIKIADSRNFTIATTTSAAEVWVEPGGMR